jgi:hypothetical protein
MASAPAEWIVPLSTGQFDVRAIHDEPPFAVRRIDREPADRDEAGCRAPAR